MRRFLSRERPIGEGMAPGARHRELVFSAEPYIIRRLYYLVKRGSGLHPTFRPRPVDGRKASGGGKPAPRGHKITASARVPHAGRPAVSTLRRNASCRRAYLRGCFLARGSVLNATRGHHLEIAFPLKTDAAMLQALIRQEGLKAGLVERRGAWVVYLKDADAISELLKLMGASGTVLEYENVRARKSLRGSVQRIVNMDKANLDRALEASFRQVDDIRVIDSELGLQHLPPALKELARLRLDHADASMEELGLTCFPPISKSAVNHRFRRLAGIASDLRNRNKPT